MLVDEERLNRFLAIDWEKVTQEIHEINADLKTLERLADAIEKLESIIGVFYEEKHDHRRPLEHLEDIERISPLW